MLGKNFIFDGNAIPYSKEEGYIEKWIADINSMNVNTSASETNRQDYHGIIAYPTFARGRVISINGEFFGTKLERGTARNKIGNVFKIPDIPDVNDQFKKLEFTDDDDTEWFCNAKVMNLPQYQHDRAGFVATFSLGLLAENPLLFSKILKEVSGFYGLYGGVQLPVMIPTQLQGGINILELENVGNFSSPLKITVSGNIINPKITQLNTGRFWKYDGTLTDETLVIDTENNLFTKDNVNVKADRGDGSNWLYANSGINYYLLTGDDFDFDNQDKASIKIEFRDAKL